MTGPGKTKGASGQAWRGYNPSAAGRHWAVPKRAIEALREEGEEIPPGLHDQLELLYQRNFIRFPERGRGGGPGVPEFKLYLEKGQPIQDIITDIPPINSQAKEMLGYPTQKPVALLDRIIKASTNEGDRVLDPFCGCATTIEAAHGLKRQWIGIDIAIHAIKRVATTGERMSEFQRWSRKLGDAMSVVGWAGAVMSSALLMAMVALVMGEIVMPELFSSSLNITTEFVGYGVAAITFDGLAMPSDGPGATCHAPPASVCRNASAQAFARARTRAI